MAPSWAVTAPEPTWEPYMFPSSLSSFLAMAWVQGSVLGRGRERAGRVLSGEGRVLLEATRLQGHLALFQFVTHFPSVSPGSLGCIRERATTAPRDSPLLATRVLWVWKPRGREGVNRLQGGRAFRRREQQVQRP